MNRLQYDDFYTEWISSKKLMQFSDVEEEEAYARVVMKNVYNRLIQ